MYYPWSIEFLPLTFWRDSVKVVSFFMRSFIGPTINIWKATTASPVYIRKQIMLRGWHSIVSANHMCIVVPTITQITCYFPSWATWTDVLTFISPQLSSMLHSGGNVYFEIVTKNIDPFWKSFSCPVWVLSFIFLAKSPFLSFIVQNNR